MLESKNHFSVIFITLLLLFFAIELLNVTQKNLVLPWTEFLAFLSSNLVSFFDSNAIAQGVVLRDKSNGFAVSIQPGCNGVEAAIVLFAAVLAYPATLKQKMLGMLIGFFAIQLLNIARIVSLFYLGQWNKTAFDWAHAYIWQALIMLDVLIIFIVWLRFIQVKIK